MKQMLGVNQSEIAQSVGGSRRKNHRAVSFGKWVLVSAVVLCGGVAAFTAPEAVQSMLPVVNTMQMQTGEYTNSVSGSGIISKITLEDNTQWLSSVGINEADIAKVEIGQKASLSGAAFEEGRYTAEVVEIAEYARQQTNGLALETVVDVTLKIENPDAQLRPGYTAHAQIHISEPITALMVPYDVIEQDEEGEYVYVLQHNRAVRRNIVTGAELPGGAELLSGLQIEDEIITNPDAITAHKLVKKGE